MKLAVCFKLSLYCKGKFFRPLFLSKWCRNRRKGVSALAGKVVKCTCNFDVTKMIELELIDVKAFNQHNESLNLQLKLLSVRIRLHHLNLANLWLIMACILYH